MKRRGFEVTVRSRASLRVGVIHVPLNVFAGHERDAFCNARWTRNFRQVDQALPRAGQHRQN